MQELKNGKALFIIGAAAAIAAAALYLTDEQPISSARNFDTAQPSAAKATDHNRQTWETQASSSQGPDKPAEKPTSESVKTSSAVSLIRNALKSNNERDRTLATRTYLQCLKFLQSRESATMESNAASAGQGSQGQHAREQMERESAALSKYCSGIESENYLTQLKNVRNRGTEFFDLANSARPYSQRLSLISSALANPRSHDIEVAIWSDLELGRIFNDRFNLDERQSVYARGLVLQELLGNSEQVDFFWSFQCATNAICRSVPLSAEDKVLPEAVAKQILRDIERQDWNQLIMSR